MKRHTNYISFLIIFASILTIENVVAQTRQMVEQETRDYYSQWIGVRASEFTHPLRNRYEDSPTLKLRDFEGKRLLLVSFDAGDFANGPRDENGTMRQLANLDAIKQQRSTNVAVIGFTTGPIFFMPSIEPPAAVKELTRFPIVNITELAHDPLQEPYNLLQRWPSLLVIDERGIIVGVYPPPLVESNIVNAFSLNSWSGAVRLPPDKVPPGSVTNWSSRNFWVVFSYTTNLSVGSEFQKGQGALKRVYFADDVPPDEISGLNSLLGKKLKRSVKLGEAIRKSDFEQ